MVESQISMRELAQEVYGEQDSAEYNAFVEKFKPKKTTDDCFTPPIIYKTVLDYCIERYGIRTEKVIRPFYPGGDYEKCEYPEDCVVVDNPPFSIIGKISRFYQKCGIRFFLFAPYLTIFNIWKEGVTRIIAPHAITYENGAKVSTAFVTNLEPGIYARADPELLRKIKQADSLNLKSDKKTKPTYVYPPYVLTATMLGYLANRQTEFTVKESDVHCVRALDSQRAVGKTIFGCGVLLSEKAAAEKAAATIWEISDREREIIAKLGMQE